LAATDPEGLTVLNVLRRFPSRSVRLNLNRSLNIIHSSSELLKQREAIVGAIQKEAIAESSAQSPVISHSNRFAAEGSVSLAATTLTLEDKSRHRRLSVDLYLPQTTGKQLVP
jgi:hypothetical protein